MNAARTTIAPVRLRLSRAKGFDLHAHSRAVNWMEAENKRLEAELAADREHYHAGSVNALAGKIGDMQLTVSPDLHWRDKEEK